jgi:hypothetical protein
MSRHHKLLTSRFVAVVTVLDPDTGGAVEIEIRKLEMGALVGLDGSCLEQLGPDEQPLSPYDGGQRFLVPDHEVTL